MPPKPEPKIWITAEDRRGCAHLIVDGKDVAANSDLENLEVDADE